MGPLDYYRTMSLISLLAAQRRLHSCDPCALLLPIYAKSIHNTQRLAALAVARYARLYAQCPCRSVFRSY